MVQQGGGHGWCSPEIRERVDHADSRIVERYRHLSDDDARRKMTKISFFNTAGKTGANIGGANLVKSAEVATPEPDDKTK